MKQDNQTQATLYAYLAGIIDGEGTIRIGRASTYKAKPNCQPRYYASVGLGMVDKRIPDLFKETFGANTRIECVPNKRPIYRWGTSGNRVVPSILKPLMPYLIVKKRQAEIVISFCENYADKHETTRECAECKKKKKIDGWGLCSACYMRAYRGGFLEKYRKNYSKITNISNSELQRREEFYQKVRKLNAVGAGATTERREAREG